MLRQILAALFPGEAPSPLLRRAWTAAFLLFPPALVAGFLLLMRNTPPVPVQSTINTAQSIQMARAYAVQQGIPVQTWAVSTSYSANETLLEFVNARPERSPLWKVAPPLSASVSFTPVSAPASGDQAATVQLSVDGKILGFTWKKPVLPDTGVTDAEALAMAGQRLPAGLAFGTPLVVKEDKDRTFTFHSASVPDTDLKATVILRGNHVTAFRVQAEPDEHAMANDGNTLQTALNIAGVCFLSLVSLFSIYRYASRTLQQEVSHQRSLLVAMLSGAFCILIGLNAVVNGDAGASVPKGAIILVFAVLGLAGGGLLAAAYGSGEGDVREAWPGKLTSLDAMLSGRILSCNVGISLLVGIMCACWLTLGLGLATTPFRLTMPQGSQKMLAPFLRMGWLITVVTYPLMALAFGAAGLLQPLAFLQRYAARARRWHLPVLIVCGGLVSALRVHSRSNIEFLAASAVFVLALLVPFFALDLLASLVCVTGLFSALGLAGSMANLSAPTDTSFLAHVLPAAAATVFAVICLKRGETCGEEQVRPLYARHIAERKSLEAEVSAAREAQLRLLPDKIPDFAGLHISAACVPAETVGGDFYDFFPLCDGRLGVFLAEGNGRGLAAALTIALAKGYLMHCVEKYSDPVEILARLETALGSIFDADSLTGFAFAAIRAGEGGAAGEIRYARTAAYPKVVVASPTGVAATERMVPVKGRTAPIAEGVAPLAAGDHVLLFTDGLGRRLATGNQHPEDVACSLAARGAQTTEQLRDSFFTYATGTWDPDDLTLVVIRTLAQAAGALEVVA